MKRPLRYIAQENTPKLIRSSGGAWRSARKLSVLTTPMSPKALTSWRNSMEIRASTPERSRYFVEA